LSAPLFEIAGLSSKACVVEGLPLGKYDTGRRLLQPQNKTRRQVFAGA
jgi:hypothetical protein